jgi:hypothetical protein
MDDHRPDYLGDSIGLTYLASGTVQALRKRQKDIPLTAQDYEALGEAAAFLEQAAYGPEILNKSQLSGSSIGSDCIRYSGQSGSPQRCYAESDPIRRFGGRCQACTTS